VTETIGIERSSQNNIGREGIVEQRNILRHDTDMGEPVVACHAIQIRIVSQDAAHGRAQPFQQQAKHRRFARACFANEEGGRPAPCHEGYVADTPPVRIVESISKDLTEVINVRNMFAHGVLMGSQDEALCYTVSNNIVSSGEDEAVMTIKRFRILEFNPGAAQAESVLAKLRLIFGVVSLHERYG
jgi:hypothetical protein